MPTVDEILLGERIQPLTVSDILLGVGGTSITPDFSGLTFTPASELYQNESPSFQPLVGTQPDSPFRQLIPPDEAFLPGILGWGARFQQGTRQILTPSMIPMMFGHLAGALYNTAYDIVAGLGGGEAFHEYFGGGSPGTVHTGAPEEEERFSSVTEIPIEGGGSSQIPTYRDTPQTWSDIANSAALNSVTIPEILTDLMDPCFHGILGQRPPEAVEPLIESMAELGREPGFKKYIGQTWDNIEDYFTTGNTPAENMGLWWQNTKDYCWENPAFALIDALIIADILGGTHGLGGLLRGAGRGVRFLGAEAAEGAVAGSRLAATAGRAAEIGTRMVEIAEGGLRPVLRVGNRFVDRNYSRNLFRQGAERAFDVTLGRNPTIIRGQQAIQPFLPGDLWNRFAATYGRSATQIVTNATVRFWTGQKSGFNVGDLTTFGREMRGLRPEDYGAFRQYHLNLSQTAAVDAATVEQILRTGRMPTSTFRPGRPGSPGGFDLDFANGTAMTASEIRAFRAAVGTTQAWNSILTGHRSIYKFLSGRNQRWIRNELYGPDTAAVLEHRPRIPAETIGLGQNIRTGEFITREQGAGLAQRAIPRLEYERAQVEASAARIRASIEERVRADYVPEPPPIEVVRPRRILGGERPRRGYQDFRRWQEEQARLGEKPPLSPEAELGTHEMGLAEIPTTIPVYGGIEVVSDPIIARYRERLFTELGWDKKNPLRAMATDGVLDYYDQSMAPMRGDIRVLTAEIDRLRAIDPGSPLLMPVDRRVAAGAPEYAALPEGVMTSGISSSESLRTIDVPINMMSTEALDMTAIRLRFVRPPDPLTVRNDLVLLRTNPELFQFIDGQMISPIYYPHQLAENLAGHLTQAMRELDSTILRPSPGWLKTNEGQLFRRGIYDQIVDRVITRNIRSVNEAEMLWNVIDDSRRDFEATEYLAVNSRDPVIRGMFRQLDDGTYELRRPPRNRAGTAFLSETSQKMIEYRRGMQRLWEEGYQVAYFDGFRTAVQGGQFQNLIRDAARKFGIEYDSLSAVERGVADRLLKDLINQSNEVINVGKPSVMPRAVMDHLGVHFGPAATWVDLFTNSARWWRKFVLPFRFAWQIGNVTSNAFTTAIHGNLGGFLDMTPEIFSRAWTTRGGSVMEEVYGTSYGEALVYMPPFQKWLLSLPEPIKPVGEALVNFNKGVNGLAMRLVELNQKFDNLFYYANQLGQARRDLMAGKPLAIEALEEARVLAGRRQLSISNLANMESTVRSFSSAMEDLYRVPKKPGTAGVAYLQELEASAAECVYRYSSLTPWQKTYMSSIIPFSGWRLFTLGLMFRFPVKYPGRAFILKTAADWGQDYVDDMYRAVGADPETIPDHERLTGIPVLATGDGNFITMRSSALNLYDTMGVERIPSFLLSHPIFRAGADIVGIGTFPVVRDLSRPPEYGRTRHGRNPLDAAGESIFGPYWDLAAHAITPYRQYETGGVFQPEIWRDSYTGEPMEQGVGRELLRMHGSLTFTEHNNYNDMARAHYGAGGAATRTENYFDALATEANADVQDRGRMRSLIGSYVTYFEQSLDQVEIMFGLATGRDRERLQSDYNSLRNQYARVMLFKAFLDNPEYEDLRISPRFLHPSSWEEPMEVTE